MKLARAGALGFAMLLTVGAAQAAQPDRPGMAKDKSTTPGRETAAPTATASFPGAARSVVRDYYRDAIGREGCPPGLARQGDGCLPPGQAKRWQIGRPLPLDPPAYELPPELAVRIGLPPQGYRYVRVAADILMVAVGTGVVADAIADLGRM